MQHKPTFANGARAEASISDAAFEQLNPVEPSLNVRELAGREVIQHDYSLAPTHQPLDDMRSDEASSARDEVSHFSADEYEAPLHERMR